MAFLFALKEESLFPPPKTDFPLSKQNEPTKTVTKLLQFVLLLIKNEKLNYPTNKTRVVHSKSKKAFNVIGTELGRKHKIARCPYIEVCGDEVLSTREKAEALNHAEFISFCFNNSEKIKMMFEQTCCNKP